MNQVCLKEGYDIEDIKLEFETSLNEHLKGVTTELTYSKVYGLLANLPSVEDISSLTLNNTTSNIVITEDKIVNILNVNISEVV